jgi:hypothetical protein
MIYDIQNEPNLFKLCPCFVYRFRAAALKCSGLVLDENTYQGAQNLGNEVTV